MCYLLDEVCRAQQRRAALAVRTSSITCWGRGDRRVTTHELDLARDAAFAAHADSVHLQETLAGEGDAVTMTFDYRLRPGPATGGNALQLLRLLGLQ